MSKSINCSSCGASNLLAKGKVSTFCAFCGSTIQNTVLDDKSDEKIHQEHFNKALIEFRDNDFDKCIKTLNKIIAKQENNKEAILYKLMCELNSNHYNFPNFFLKLQEFSIFQVEEIVEFDLYKTLSKHILPKYSSTNLFYDNKFIYLDKLIEFLNYQSTPFKIKVLHLLPEIYSWENHRLNHKFYYTDFKDYTEDWEGVGYRPKMVDEIENLINLLANYKIDVEIIIMLFEEIKNLVLNSLNYYFDEIEKKYANYISDKEDITIYQVSYLIKRYYEINEIEPLLIIIKKIEKKTNIDIDLNDLSNKIESLNIKVKVIANNLTKNEKNGSNLNWKLFAILLILGLIVFKFFSN